MIKLLKENKVNVKSLDKECEKIRVEMSTIHEKYGVGNKYDMKLRKKTPIEVQEKWQMLLKKLGEKGVQLRQLRADEKNRKKESDDKEYESQKSSESVKLQKLLKKYGFENASSFKDEHVSFNGESGNLVINLSGHLPFLSFFSDAGNNGIFGKGVKNSDLKLIKKISGEPKVKW